eukprot:SAG31_NODE_18325_length_640_cov_0.953789_1_plen_22_part_10
MKWLVPAVQRLRKVRLLFFGSI